MDKSARIANREAWIQRLDRFSLSDKTVVQFCQDERVSVPSFYQWRKRLQPKLNTSEETATVHASAKFLPVELPSASINQPITVVSLDLPGGIGLRIEVKNAQEQTS